MPASFLVVCEAEADYRIASQLAERVLVREFEWLEQAMMGCSLWQVKGLSGSYLRWTQLRALASQEEITVHGHFDGDPAKLHARRTKLALRLWKRLWPHAEGVILIGDSDRNLKCREGMEQAREQSEFRDRTVVALPHPCREAWVLVGFIAGSETEERKLAELRTELSFDPCHKPERLHSRDDDARSAKRVVRILTDQDHQRESHCWLATDLDHLIARGESSGLADYLRNRPGINSRS